MATVRKSRLVELNDEPLVDWVSEPRFEFATEVDALQMLQSLGEELRASREQVRHTMRFLAAAVVEAAQTVEDGTPISRQAIIRESGLARQTVYDLLGDQV